MQIDPYVENWAVNVGKKIMYDKGASSESALPFARLYGYAFMDGLNPTVIRIYSSAKRQLELQQRYDAGDKRGLRVRPATTSKHIRERLNQPASDAIDMPCSTVENDRKCAIIARELKLRTGETFQVSDPGHYDLP